ncbi:hypothetical protein ZWY2020_002128 [Hordeum vulgare]|nr:hypothetical protein ZWY2020_002128 [Hordeum vulgare]
MATGPPLRFRKGQKLADRIGGASGQWVVGSPFSRFKARSRPFPPPSLHPFDAAGRRRRRRERARGLVCTLLGIITNLRSIAICELAAAAAMQQELAALACQAGFVGHPTHHLPPHDVDFDLVDGWLASGSGGAGGGNGDGPPSCGSGLSHVAGAAAAVSETRKARRLASNRESARRSRMRRRRQLDELSACAAELRAANQRLVVDLNRAEARHAQVARENARLRGEVRRLRERLAAEEEATDRDASDEAAAARTP